MKDLKLYIGILATLLVLYLVAQYNKPSPINWTTTLRYNDKVPYGTFILYDRLHDLLPDATVERVNRSPYQTFTDTAIADGCYLIMANSVSFSDEDNKALVKYLRRGNTVFISTFTVEGTLGDSLKTGIRPELSKQTIGVNLVNDLLHTPVNYRPERHIADQYFDGLDTAKAVVLGENTLGHANFVSYKVGKGRLLVHANPLLMSNYSMLDADGARYAARVLSYLPANTKHIYWDQYQNHDVAVDESPMRVFFAFPALRWAYYIALAGMLLFVIYEVKRRQRIIPVVEPLKNSTVDFVTVVGRVYYEQRDNANIATKKIMYLTEHLRTYFGLKAGGYHADLVEPLANKTGISHKFANELVIHINYLMSQSRVSDSELLLLNNLIEKFHSQSRS